MSNLPSLTQDVWHLCNGKRIKICRTREQACMFLGIGQTSFTKHYNSGTATKSGWTIDKIEVEKE